MFRKLKENLNTFVGEFFNTYYFNLNYSLSNIRPRLVKSLVIVRFYVIILMCATVIIVIDHFCFKEILFRNKRKKTMIFLRFREKS